MCLVFYYPLKWRGSSLSHTRPSKYSKFFFIISLFSSNMLTFTKWRKSTNISHECGWMNWMVLWYGTKYNEFAWCSCFPTGTSTLGPTLCAHSVVFFSIIIIIIIKFPLSWWEMRRKIVADVELEIYLWTWKCVSEQRCNPK